MKPKTYFMATLLLSFLFVTANTGLFAEEQRSRERTLKREKAGKMLETVTLWKLVDGLKLSEEQLVKFLPKYREGKDLKEEYQEKRMKVVEELKDLLQAKKVSARKIEAKLTQLEKMEDEQRQKSKDLQKELKSILTPEQQARFILLQKQIGREMMQQLRKRMEERKGERTSQQSRKPIIIGPFATKMRIAFASEENKGIKGSLAHHFGRCPYYVFIDVEDGKIKKIETRENPSSNQHQPGAVPQFVAEEEASVIIAGSMGPMAIDWFKKLGVQPVTGVSGEIKDILNDYLAGKLTGSEPCDEHRK